MKKTLLFRTLSISVVMGLASCGGGGGDVSVSYHSDTSWQEEQAKLRKERQEREAKEAEERRKREEEERKKKEEEEKDAKEIEKDLENNKIIGFVVEDKGGSRSKIKEAAGGNNITDMKYKRQPLPKTSIWQAVFLSPQFDFLVANTNQNDFDGNLVLDSIRNEGSSQNSRLNFSKYGLIQGDKSADFFAMGLKTDSKQLQDKLNSINNQKMFYQGNMLFAAYDTKDSIGYKNSGLYKGHLYALVEGKLIFFSNSINKNILGGATALRIPKIAKIQGNGFKGKEGNTQIEGAFYGKNAEEMSGVFVGETNNSVGSLYAKGSFATKRVTDSTQEKNIEKRFTDKKGFYVKDKKTGSGVEEFVVERIYSGDPLDIVKINNRTELELKGEHQVIEQLKNDAKIATDQSIYSGDQYQEMRFGLIQDDQFNHFFVHGNYSWDSIINEKFNEEKTFAYSGDLLFARYHQAGQDLGKGTIFALVNGKNMTFANVIDKNIWGASKINLPHFAKINGNHFKGEEGKNSMIEGGFFGSNGNTIAGVFSGELIQDNHAQQVHGSFGANNRGEVGPDGNSEANQIAHEVEDLLHNLKRGIYLKDQNQLATLNKLTPTEDINIIKIGDQAFNLKDATDINQFTDYGDTEKVLGGSDFVKYGLIQDKKLNTNYFFANGKLSLARNIDDKIGSQDKQFSYAGDMIFSQYEKPDSHKDMYFGKGKFYALIKNKDIYFSNTIDTRSWNADINWRTKKPHLDIPHQAKIEGNTFSAKVFPDDKYEREISGGFYGDKGESIAGVFKGQLKQKNQKDLTNIRGSFGADLKEDGQDNGKDIAKMIEENLAGAEKEQKETQIGVDQRRQAKEYSVKNKEGLLLSITQTDEITALNSGKEIGKVKIKDKEEDLGTSLHNMNQVIDFMQTDLAHRPKAVDGSDLYKYGVIRREDGNHFFAHGARTNLDEIQMKFAGDKEFIYSGDMVFSMANSLDQDAKDASFGKGSFYAKVVNKKIQFANTVRNGGFIRNTATNINYGEMINDLGMSGKSSLDIPYEADIKGNTFEAKQFTGTDKERYIQGGFYEADANVIAGIFTGQVRLGDGLRNIRGSFGAKVDNNKFSEAPAYLDSVAKNGEKELEIAKYESLYSGPDNTKRKPGLQGKVSEIQYRYDSAKNTMTPTKDFPKEHENMPSKLVIIESDGYEREYGLNDIEDVKRIGLTEYDTWGYVVDEFKQPLVIDNYLNYARIAMLSNEDAPTQFHVIGERTTAEEFDKVHTQDSIAYFAGNGLVSYKVDDQVMHHGAQIHAEVKNKKLEYLGFKGGEGKLNEFKRQDIVRNVDIKDGKFQYHQDGKMVDGAFYGPYADEMAGVFSGKGQVKHGETNENATYKEVDTHGVFGLKMERHEKVQ